MTHRRSKESRQRRSLYSRCLSAAEKAVSDNSFYDERKRETINRVTQTAIETAMVAEVGYSDPTVLRRFTQGEVLQDTRGQGSQQVVIISPEWGWRR